MRQKTLEGGRGNELGLETDNSLLKLRNLRELGAGKVSC